MDTHWHSQSNEDQGSLAFPEKPSPGKAERGVGASQNCVTRTVGVTEAMEWNESYLDAILIPFGLAVMIGYHLLLMLRIRSQPLTTVIGMNHVNRKAWVEFIMKDGKGNGVLAVQTIRNSIMASTLLASTAITLSSLLGALVSGFSSSKSSTLVLGSHLPTVQSVKYVSILVTFLIAFVFHVQAIRYFSHASFLISIPMGDSAPGLTPEYVNRLIQRSTDFFWLGLRAFYFSFPLLLWLYGPIFYFACCIGTVVLLSVVDNTSEFKPHLSPSHKTEMVVLLDPSSEQHGDEQLGSDKQSQNREV